MVIQEDRNEQVQVLRVEDHCIELDEDALREVLLNDRIKDKDVAVISLAGDFRKGKSFMLSFFLRFLCNLGSPVWLGGPNEPLRGFAWRGGSERHTTGILIWKEVFLVKTGKDEELAVLLMDTQGMHDDNSTVKECASIFALTTMLSSVLVFNISQNIQEDDLQHLQLFTDYGQLAGQHVDMSGNPFQKLLFLVRDWYHINDAAYGAKGGRGLLEQRLKQTRNQHQQMKQLREHIHSCFTEIDCFLMPHPGLKVAQGISFDGRLSDISEDFREQLLHLVPSILAPEKLIPKDINGQKVTCQQLFLYMMVYVHIFKGDVLPEPKTVFEATAEGNHLAALFTALEQYRTKMVELCSGQKLARKKLQRLHCQERSCAMDTFDNTRKMGAETLSESYRQKLLEEMDKWYRCFAPGMMKKCILETNGCKLAEGLSAGVFTVAAFTCFVVGLPIHCAICGVAAGVALCTLVSTAVYDCCVSDFGTDTYSTGKKADKEPSKQVPPKGQHFRDNNLDADFLRQCFNKTPKVNRKTNLLESKGRAKENYLITMREICREGMPFVKPDMLYDIHCEHRQTALTTFRSACEMAGMKPLQSSVAELAQEIDEEFDNFFNQNASNMGFASRTIARMRAKFKKSSAPYFRIKED